MLKSDVILINLLLLFTTSIFSQQIDFEKKLGNSFTADWGYDVIQTSDGGYVVAGLTGELFFGMEDILLMKTDQFGDTLWTKIFGEAGKCDVAYSVIETGEGNLVILAQTESYGEGATDILIIKTDLNGNKLWSKTYGGHLNDFGFCLKSTVNDDFVIGGSTASFGNGEYDVYLLMLDRFGDTLWTNTYGSIYSDYGYDLVPTDDGGYILTGYTYGYQADYLDVYLLKVDMNGVEQWYRTFDGPEIGSSSGDFGTKVQLTADGGYIITGGEGSIFATGFTGKALLLKTDSTGEIMWSKTFGQVNIDDSQGADVIQLEDGGYVVAASRSTFGEDLDAYMIRTDSFGDTLWTKTINGGYTEKALGLTMTSAEDYVMTGYAYTMDNWYQVYLVKVSDLETGHTNKEFPDNNEYSLYPNPTNGVVMVVFPDETGIHARVGIFNMLGEKVINFDQYIAGSSIDLSDFGNGFYLVTVEGNGTRALGKVSVY